MAADQNANTPSPKKARTVWYILSGVTVGILVFCCAGGGLYLYWDYSNKKTADERRKRVESDPGVAVSASHLATLASEAADRGYKDKVVVVSGSIHSIDGKTVYLDGFIFTTVSCEFSEGYKFQVANLRENMSVRIKGVCTSTRDALHGVTVKECCLVEF